MSTPEQSALFPDPNQPPTPEELAANAAAIAANALEHPYVEEDRTSEAARDQGWGVTERGVPIEDPDHPRRKPEAIAAQREAQAKRRRRRGVRETRFTDIGSDTQDSDPAYNPDLKTEKPEPRTAATEVALGALSDQLARRKLERDAAGDPKRMELLARARGIKL